MNDQFRVEFYPSVDDYAYVAEKINASATSKNSLTNRIYAGYLVINAILIPAILLVKDLFFIGLILFIFNIAVVYFLFPSLGKFQYKKFYESLLGDISNELCVAELRTDGFFCARRGLISFVPWDDITVIVEEADSIYFFWPHNGFGVRKSGFAYEQDKNAFLQFARQQTTGNRTNRLSE